MSLAHLLPRAVFAPVVAAALLLSGCSSEPLTPVVVVTKTSAVPAETLNPDVRPETIHETICLPGYTAAVRPSTTYTNGVKRKLIREQGLPATDDSKYELDHVIPLALGGHPRNLKNLALQLWDGDDGARKKDQLERKLQRLVCDGRVGLREAQTAIYVDWKAALLKYSP